MKFHEIENAQNTNEFVRFQYTFVANYQRHLPILQHLSGHFINSRVVFGIHLTQDDRTIFENNLLSIFPKCSYYNFTVHLTGQEGY